MSTELIAISAGLPKTALERPLGTTEEALDVVRALTTEPARYKGVKKLDSVLVGNRPCIGVGTYGDAIVAVANDLPALGLAWQTLRTEREASDFYFVGAYPTSSGVEILHTVGTTVVRHYSVTEDKVEHDEGDPAPFEEIAQSLTLRKLEDLYEAAPSSHRRVESDGSRYLLDADAVLIGRVNTFQIDPQTDQTWIPIDAEAVDDADEDYINTDALADAAVQDWFGFELLDAPKRLKTHVFEI